MTDAPADKGMGIATKAMLGLAAILALLVLQFGFLFLIIALLPSVMAYFIEIDRKHTCFKTVLACNLAATLPFIMPMIRKGIKLEHYDSTSLIASPEVWLIVYSGAAAGWCLIFLCRYIARFIITMMYEYQIIYLDRLQAKLLAEWGDQLKETEQK